MKEAHRQGAWFTLILGDDELERGEAQLRDMRTSAQQAAPLDYTVGAAQTLRAQAIPRHSRRPDHVILVNQYMGASRRLLCNRYIGDTTMENNAMPVTRLPAGPMGAANCAPLILGAR